LQAFRSAGKPAQKEEFKKELGPDMNLYGARLREMEEKEKLKKAMTPPA
jgi:hypothetical protein